MDATAIDLHERMPPASPPSILRSAKPSPSPSLFELPGPAHPIPTPGPGASTTTLYLPIAAPPTPAPSPRPSPVLPPPLSSIPNATSPYAPLNSTPAAALAAFTALAPAARGPFLAALLSPATLSPAELRAAAARIAPLLTRDFLGDLPPELALHVLGFVDEPRALIRVGRVCRRWGALVGTTASEGGGEGVWRGMCAKWGFDLPEMDAHEVEAEAEEEPLEALEHLAAYPLDPALQWLAHRARSTSPTAPAVSPAPFSWKAHFAREYNTRTCPPSPPLSSVADTVLQ